MKKSNKKTYCFVAVGVILGGIAILTLQLLAPIYTDNLMAGIVGGMLCVIAVDLAITSYRCKQQIWGTLIDYGFEQYKAHLTSSPVFTYEYEGKHYQSKAAECFSQQYVLKHYKKGERYPLYLNPHSPTLIKLKRRIGCFELLLFVIGFGIVMFAIIGCFVDWQPLSA